jgi:hypothetical protein
MKTVGQFHIGLRTKGRVEVDYLRTLFAAPQWIWTPKARCELNLMLILGCARGMKPRGTWRQRCHVW